MRSSLMTVGLVVLVGASVAAQGTAPSPAQRPAKTGAKPTPNKLSVGSCIAPDIKLRDINGKPYTTTDFKGRITVVTFWGTRCPSTKLWDLALAAIVREYAKKGVTFLTIDANEASGEIRDQSLAKGQKPYQEIRRRLAQANLPYTVLIDRHSRFADILGAKTTPHVFVFDKRARLAYRGLIDDDPAAVKGANATPHLRNALGALLAGGPVARGEIPPTGSPIRRRHDLRSTHVRINREAK